MENLKIILDKLKSKRDSFNGNYYIPKAWLFDGFTQYGENPDRKGEVSINPYDFYISSIENAIMPKAYPNALCALGNGEGDIQNDVNKSVIYSMFIRMFTAWSHKEPGNVCYGTLLKTISLLPYLKSMDVNVLYLLPIFKYSDVCKKGELGSPYAIKNIYQLDENLHDSLLGDNEQALLETEFKAFVEACHVLGIKVMVDFVFRTVARDNDLIIEHPEWFYWINKENVDTFKSPSVEGLPELSLLNDETLISLYRSKDIKSYLSAFSKAPSDLDGDKWNSVLTTYNKTGQNILELIEKEFNITTAPGFSDVINDPQPAWTDVTYLKYCYDVHDKVKPFISSSQNPFVLPDSIKCNLYCGNDTNNELWDYIAGVIPYYQTKYGIDGARIDMGHALPTTLNKEMVRKVKENNNNFLLWSEEFWPERSQHAKDDGFHFISGFIWSIFKEVEQLDFNKTLLEDTLLKAAIPVTAALETPDTPRAALVHKNRTRLELLLLLGSFIPNAIPFLNNGFEVMETQPMNLGLDNTEAGRYVLDREDPMYGKLAFFDNYQLHWTNEDRFWMQERLYKVKDLRARFADIISKKENFIPQPELYYDKIITFLCYFDENKGKGVFLLANRSFQYNYDITLEHIFPYHVKNRFRTLNILYENFNTSDYKCDIYTFKSLRPGEVIIGSFE